MKKVAYTDTGNLLSGLGSWGLAGAGLGAAGMGAATALSPDDENGKHKSILKSMMLGGALGGLTGAGVRAGADYLNPALATDPGFGAAELNKAPAAQPQTGVWNGIKGAFGNLKDIVAARPGYSGIGAAAGTTIGSNRIQARAAKLYDVNFEKTTKDYEKKISLSKDLKESAAAGLGTAPTAPAAPAAPAAPGRGASQQQVQAYQQAMQQHQQAYQQAMQQHQQAMQQHQANVAAAQRPHEQTMADFRGKLNKLTDADIAFRNPSELRKLIKNPAIHGLAAGGLITGLGYPLRQLDEADEIYQNANQTQAGLTEQLGQSLQTAKQ